MTLNQDVTLFYVHGLKFYLSSVFCMFKINFELQYALDFIQYSDAPISRYLKTFIVLFNKLSKLKPLSTCS